MPHEPAEIYRCVKAAGRETIFIECLNLRRREGAPLFLLSSCAKRRISDRLWIDSHQNNHQRCFAPLNMTGSVAEGNVYVTRGLHHFAVRRNELEPIDSFRDRHLAHLVILVTDHRTEVTFVG
jgi:hypothetical protein